MNVICSNSPFVFRNYISGEVAHLSTLFGDMAAALLAQMDSAPTALQLGKLYNLCYENEQRQLNEWEELPSAQTVGAMYACYADWLKMVGDVMFSEIADEAYSCNAWIPEDWRDVWTITRKLENQIVEWLTGETILRSDEPHPMAYFLTLLNGTKTPGF